MLIKRSLTLAGHRTSVALEAEFWRAIEEIAERRGATVAALVAAEDAVRAADEPLASRLRLLVLRVLRS